MPSRHLFALPAFLAALSPALAAPPDAPSDLIFARSDANNLGTLEWVDNATDETYFEFEVSIPGSDPFVNNGVRPPPNTQTFDFIGFTPGVGIGFRIRSVKNDGINPVEASDWSNSATISTIAADVYTSALTATPGQDFHYEIPEDFDAVTFASTGALPAWLTLDPATGELVGTAPPAGSLRINYEANAGIHYRSGFLYINVINEQPVLLAPVPAVTIIDQPDGGAPVEIDLATVFEDQDLFRAARIDTVRGPIEIGFYEGFPVTVNNFFAYAESDAWDGSFFHRMAILGNGEDFVLQGGGYKPGATPDAYTAIPDLDPIGNEFDPERSNICGSISMAKLGGDPDSATNEFFISLNDNASNLDNQNGGFTVFARATNIAAANEIANLPRATYNVPLDDRRITFDDWPFTTIDESSPNHDHLASINDVNEIPPLLFTAELAGDAVVSATTANNVDEPLLLTPNGTVGEAVVTLTATDLDGAAISTTFDVTVLNSYSAWADAEGAPPIEMATSRPPGGGLSFLQSYAFGGDPTDPADDLPLLPMVTTVDLDGITYDALTFHHRDLTSDLSYRFEMSSNLVDWTALWTTADGYDAEAVANAVDSGSFTTLTVRVPTPATEIEEIYLRVTVILNTPDV